ncbi:MAG: pentapeptide repeat-containing protein [Phototrophicaceae bacterium]
MNKRRFNPEMFIRFDLPMIGIILVAAVLFVLGQTYFGVGKVYEGYDFWMSVFMEILSIMVTTVLLGMWDSRRKEQELKDELTFEASSHANETVKLAIDRLRYLGWLEGKRGLLQGVDLSGAHMQGAKLARANLQGSVLEDALLQNADLAEAILRNVQLSRANLANVRLGSANLSKSDIQDCILHSANMVKTNLHEANLLHADLSGATLLYADLKGANLGYTELGDVAMRGANLANVHNINQARFNENSVLPNGDRWQKGYDLRIFTEVSHPQFWRSDDPNSPAYHGVYVPTGANSLPHRL